MEQSSAALYNRTIMIQRPASLKMRVSLIIGFFLCHFTTAQHEDGTSAGSLLSCSTEIISELKELKTMMEEQKDHINKQKQSGDHLCIPTINSELKELKTKVEEERVKLEDLQKQLTDKPNIAFSASLFGHSGHTVGGHSSEVVLKFQKVFVNIGNAYSSATGIFTAPVRGVYYFGFSAFANDKYSMGVHLRKNGEQIVATYDYNSNHKDVNGSNRAVLLLEKGDQVNIGLWSGLYIFDSYNSVSTFSGFLLFQM